MSQEEEEEDEKWTVKRRSKRLRYIRRN